MSDTHGRRSDRASDTRLVAIIGMGCLFPKAEDVAAYWANIRNGVDAITDVPETHWRADDYYAEDPQVPDHVYAAKGGFLSPVEFNPMKFGILPNALEATDTSQLLGLVAAEAALKDAGYGPDSRFDRDRVSVILGVTGALELVIPLGARLGFPVWRESLKEAGVDESTAEDVIERIADSYVPWQENSFPGLLGNVVAGRIAKHLGLGGTNCVVDAACASAFSAIYLAEMELASGQADMVITGGVDTFNDVFMYACFSKTPALSPSGHARPFDATADGTTLGEGLGMVVLKRLEDAERDGDRIYAVIRGMGTSSDGRDEAIYAPSPIGQVKALRRAYRVTNVSPDTIALLEAHGTGTKAGDASEIASLAEVYGEFAQNGPWCALGSVKSQIGHTKAAAGAAGLIKAAMALHTKVLPPTIKVTQPAKELTLEQSPFYVNVQKRPWLPRESHPRRAAVSSFGFGGSNYHCVLEEYRPERTTVDWDTDVQIAAFSSDSVDALEAALDALPVSGAWREVREVAAQTRAAFNAGQVCRLVLVLERGRTDLVKLLAGAKEMLARNADRAAWTTPDGAFFGSGTAPGKLGMVFPGQGAQRPGMFRDLACAFPQMLDALADADAVFMAGQADKNGQHLSDLIYPHPAFDEQTKASQEKPLRSTQVAQPAIGAVSLGALEVLESFGVQPDAVAGHSYGELVALYAAGRFDRQGLHTLSKVRGKLMGQGGGDRGAMLAVQASASEIEAILEEEGLDVTLANKNSPVQMVLSGATEAIEHAAEALKKGRIRRVRLDVAAAFHSPFVAEACEPFLDALERVKFAEARIPIYSNTTADEYPADAAAARELLARHLARPIEFIREIENMYEAGVRTFLEVGPGAVLTGLISAILPASHTFAVDASKGQRSGFFDLACVLGRLAALGYPVTLAAWDDGALQSGRETDTKKPAMTVSICGANYVKPKPKRPPTAPKKTGTAPSDRVPESPARQVPPPKRLRTPRVGGSRYGDAARDGTVPVVSTGPAVTPAQPAATGALADALRQTQENMAALQKMQEQTARLHQQFLESQETTARTFQELVEQQRRLLQTGAMAAPAAATPVSTEPSPPPVTVEPLPTEQPAESVPDGTSWAQIGRLLLEVVAEKTGYPVDMLELDMGLDSDLGIDSIKRVEILSALQESLPELPQTQPEDLSKFQTLRDVVQFLCGSADGNGVVGAEPAHAEPTVDVEPPEDGVVQRSVLQAVPIDVEQKPVTIPDGAEVWVCDDGSALASCIVDELEARRYATKRVPVDNMARQEAASRLGGLVMLAPEKADDAFLKSAFKLLQRAAPGLRAAGRQGGALLVTVSRLDGAFGLAGLGAETEPVSGGLAGLAKTAQQEWPEVQCKALDLAADFDHYAEAASAIGDEMLLSGVTEVGLSHGGRRALRLVPAALDDERGEAPLVPGDLVVVSGGARGVTAEVAIALAKAFQPAFLLLGRSSPPTPEPDWLAPLTGEAEIKKALLSKHGLSQASPRDGTVPVGSDAKLSPKELEAHYRAVSSNREVRHNIARIEAAGAKVMYRSADVRDADAVEAAVAEAREQSGPVKGLIHGAGVIADRLIEDKREDEFESVYSTKVGGLRALLAALGSDELRVMALFSSSTGRFGRTGQVDYAVANEVLNKMAQHQARLRPMCRVVSINWGPWAGGMVTPSLRRVFEQEGISLIALEAGARCLVREISQKPGAPVEVVVFGGKAEVSKQGDSAPLPLAFELELDVERYPFLKSHVIGGQAVLPMAVIVEWLAHGALHGNPGLRFCGFNDLRELKGVILAPGETRTVRVLAGKAAKSDACFVVATELRSTDGTGQDILHARAEVVLVTKLEAGKRTITGLSLEPFSRDIKDIYAGNPLFHGPHLQGIESVEGCSEQGIVAQVKPSPGPAAWIDELLRNTWLADPLALDCSFQMMVLWTFERRGAASLPISAGRYRQFKASFPTSGVRIEIRIKEDAPHRASADIEFLDPATGALVARIEDYECVIDASLNEKFRRNRLIAES